MNIDTAPNLTTMTMANSTTPDNPSLTFTGCFPLVWHPVHTLPAANQQVELASANGEVLKALLLLDTPLGELGDDAAEAGMQDMARLDFKLNLLLDMMGQLLLKQRIVPQARPLTLMPQSLIWQDDDAPVLDSLLQVELYCSMKYPRPLRLYGRVVEVNPQNSSWWIQLALQALGEGLQEGLERFIFIHHRRAVAQSRRRSQ